MTAKTKKSAKHEEEIIGKKGFKVGMKVHMLKKKGISGKIVSIEYPADDAKPGASPMIVYKKTGESKILKNRPSVLTLDQEEREKQKAEKARKSA